MDPRLLTQLILSTVVLAAFIVLSLLLKYVIHRYAQRRGFVASRPVAVRKTCSLLLLFIMIFALSTVWGIDFEGLLIFSTGVFTLIGIAFFAVWSILSNITAGVLIFFRYPYRIGDRVTVADLPDCHGRIVDVTMWHMMLENDDGDRFAIPNNVVVQRIIRIEKREQGWGE